MNPGDLEISLHSGLTALGFDHDDHPCAAYLAYIDLLGHWNRAYNLTAIQGAEKMLSWHVLDALSILPYLYGRYCLDVGTGAGVPGLILALANPDRHWVVLDSNSKKIRFVTQAVIELEIDNVEVIRTRVEDYKPATLFTTVTARAFSSLSLLFERTRQLLARDGILLAMKGTELTEEIAQLAQHGQDVQVHVLQVPGVDSGRSLVEVRLPG